MSLICVYMLKRRRFSNWSSRVLASLREFSGRWACAALDEKRGGDREQQPAVGKMRVAGDVLVRRLRGGQRQDHPPRCCPGSVHARRRGSFPKTRERSRDTTGTKSVFGRVYKILFLSLYNFHEEQSQIGKTRSLFKIMRCYNDLRAKYQWNLNSLIQLSLIHAK